MGGGNRLVRAATAVVVALVATACTSGDRSATGFEVEVTGMVRHHAEGTELCIIEVQPCSGFTLTGGADGLDEGWVRVRGRLAGGALSPTRPVKAVEPPTVLTRDTRFAPTCDPPRGGWPTPPIGADAGPYGPAFRSQPDLAGVWVDPGSGVTTVAFTGDLERHRAELLQYGSAVCVVRRAHTLTELDSVKATLLDVLGPELEEAGTDMVRNVVVAGVRILDGATAERLDDALGRRRAALDLTAYVRVLSGTAAAVEPPPVPDQGGPVLATQRWDGANPRLAELRSVLRYDATLDCLYLGDGPTRTLPVWPYGYRSTRDPIRVLDADGRPVAQVGDRLSASGGGRDIATYAQHCGATGAFEMGYPTVVG